MLLADDTISFGDAWLFLMCFFLILQKCQDQVLI